MYLLTCVLTLIGETLLYLRSTIWYVIIQLVALILLEQKKKVVNAVQPLHFFLKTLTLKVKAAQAIPHLMTTQTFWRGREACILSRKTILRLMSQKGCIMMTVPVLVETKNKQCTRNNTTEQVICFASSMPTLIGETLQMYTFTICYFSHSHLNTHIIFFLVFSQQISLYMEVLRYYTSCIC